MFTLVSHFSIYLSLPLCVCVCVQRTFCDGMQSVSDLEMPSISFNWTHIQWNCQHDNQSVYFQARKASASI